MSRLLRPKPLPRGGTIAIAAPAAAVDAGRLEAGVARWTDAGFRVRRRDDLLARHRYLAGDDRRRAAELSEFVLDPEIDAVICARGGYGSQRIVSLLSSGGFRASRKALMGYSDISTLLLWQARRAGLGGIHGPMIEGCAALSDAAFGAVLDALTAGGRLPLVRRGAVGRGGRAAGRLVGGSLTAVAASLGTPWEVRTRGAILLLEDVGERPYRLDRMLEQLRHAGALRHAAGVGLGHFSGCDEPGGGLRGEEILDAWLGTLSCPWVKGLPFGHAAPNLPWPVGGRAELVGERAELRILDHFVEAV